MNKMRLWQSWIKSRNKSAVKEYQYTSPPVYQCISIPVHLYTSVLVYQSTCIPVTPKRQYTSPPVYQSLRKPVYQSTCIPVTKNASIPVAAVTTLPPTDVSALWFVAPSSRCHRHVDHICPSRPGAIPGPKDHHHTALVKYRVSRILLLPCLVKIPGL